VAQSTTDGKAIAARAIDGNTNSDFKGGSCSSTQPRGYPWWRADLTEAYQVNSVTVYNRGDCCGGRLNGFQVRVGAKTSWTGNPRCGEKAKRNTILPGGFKKVECKGRQGRFVHVVLLRRNVVLTLCEVKVVGRAVRLSPTAASRTRATQRVCNFPMPTLFNPGRGTPKIPKQKKDPAYRKCTTGGGNPARRPSETTQKAMVEKCGKGYIARVAARDGP